MNKIAAALVVLGVGVLVLAGGFVAAQIAFADECDPSENRALSEMTTGELDELCGLDRGFRFDYEE